MEHPDTLNALHFLANLSRDSDNLDEARVQYDTVLNGLVKLGHPLRYLAMYDIGILLRKQGDEDGATSMIRAAYEGLNDVFGPENEHTKDAQKALGE